MRNIFITCLTLTFCLAPIITRAQSVMTSNKYKIQSDSVNFGGIESSSTNYATQDTAGEAGSGQTDSTSYSAYLGYQFMGLAAPDTTPPSAPSSLSAQAISASEIELSWGAATDNVSVDRYNIYRNGVKIDNVANFPRDYDDTGLSSGVTYSYNVSAVDEDSNEGPWSATTTATTLAPTSIVSTSRTVLLSNLLITSNDTNASLSFDTSIPRLADIKWGTDNTYSTGELSDVVGNNHSFILPNLTPNTLYFLQISLKDQFGNPSNVTTLSFRTLSIAISKSPTNVSNFSALGKESQIDLSWKMPLDSKVVGVKIVRSDKSYPSGPDDGDTIFENKDNSGDSSFSDTNVKKGTLYYYAIFTQDLAGNLSSGAIASAKTLVPGEVAPANPLETLLPAGSVDPKIENLTLNDFLFIQSGNSVPVSGNSVSIRGDQNTTVALTYYKVPPVLKIIAVSIITKETEPRRFTFILRPNRDKTRYEATIGPLGDAKLYDVHVDILDFKNEGLKTIKGNLNVVIPAIESQNFFNTKVEGYAVVGALGFVVILGAVVIVNRRRKLPLIDTRVSSIGGQ